MALDVFSLTERTVSAESALSSDIKHDIALAQYRDWVIICQLSSAIILNGRGISQVSKNTVAYGFVLSSVTSSFSFRWYSDELEKYSIFYRDGNVVEQHGQILDEEGMIDVPSGIPDEMWIFSLIERFTGITLRELQSLSYVLATP